MSILYEPSNEVFRMTQRVSDYCEIEIIIEESTMDNILCLSFVEQTT